MDILHLQQYLWKHSQAHMVLSYFTASEGPMKNNNHHNNRIWALLSVIHQGSDEIIAAICIYSRGFGASL